MGLLYNHQLDVDRYHFFARSFLHLLEMCDGEDTSTRQTLRTDWEEAKRVMLQTHQESAALPTVESIIQKLSCRVCFRTLKTMTPHYHFLLLSSSRFLRRLGSCCLFPRVLVTVLVVMRLSRYFKTSRWI